jgi:anti-sigma regulatory factor (Ser/Thr protein kinase)
MPLGLMPDLNYEENETHLAPGESILLYSDGLVEAHNLQREMFSFNRLRELVGIHPGGTKLIESLLAELAKFTGEEWEQEDDVTFVTLERLTNSNNVDQSVAIENQPIATGDKKILAEFQLPSEPGRERQAMEHVAIAVTELHLPSARLVKLKTAVAEATMNAIEHGNHFRPELPVSIKVLASDEVLTVSITDKGGDQIIPERDAPDLEAKLAGLQSPRGWGLFLIKNMVDEMKISTDQSHHTVELIFLLEGGQDAG